MISNSYFLTAIHDQENMDIENLLDDFVTFYIAGEPATIIV